MVSALGRLGVGVEREPGRLVVTGVDGRPRGGGRLYARQSGTTMRFISAMALLGDGPVVVDGDEALRRRPHSGLVGALRQLGASVEPADDRPPLTITPAGLAGGHVAVDARASSQFATALLLVAPYAASDLTVEALGLRDDSYVALTLEVMERWGAQASRTSPGSYLVRAGATYSAREEEVEHDASAAAHLYALAAATSGSVTVENARPTSQPDWGMLDLLASMGAAVTSGPGGVTVSSSGGLDGIDVSLAEMPDQVPTVAVLGALARGTTRIRDAAIARGHESDRLAVVASGLRALGVPVEEQADGLVVTGGARMRTGRVPTHDDHRIAMAFAVLARALPGIEIEGPGCVAKTYPRFWDDLSALGLVVD